jgi:uncharacterized OB-fold protein
MASDATPSPETDPAPDTWLPVRAPHPTPETQRFWDATAQGRIELARCTGCSLIPWYPRSICPDCQGTDWVWEALAGTGTVYAYSVTRAGGGRAWKAHLPFVVAYVELDEGPRMLTNIVDCDPDDITIGMAVTAVFDNTGEQTALVRFRPSG